MKNYSADAYVCDHQYPSGPRVIKLGVLQDIINLLVYFKVNFVTKSALAMIIIIEL